MTMQGVIDKIKDHLTLHNQEAKNVCNRNCSEWHVIQNGNKPETDSAAERRDLIG